jgi:hypothetical protein
MKSIIPAGISKLALAGISLVVIAVPSSVFAYNVLTKEDKTKDTLESSATPTPSQTVTPTLTPTPTDSPTPTITSTSTPTPTITATKAVTSTPTKVVATTAPTTVAKIAPTAEPTTKTYTNSTYHISFTYPKDYTVTTNEIMPGTVIINVSKDASTYLELNYTNLGRGGMPETLTADHPKLTLTNGKVVVKLKREDSGFLYGEFAPATTEFPYGQNRGGFPLNTMPDGGWFTFLHSANTSINTSGFDMVITSIRKI